MKLQQLTPGIAKPSSNEEGIRAKVAPRPRTERVNRSVARALSLLLDVAHSSKALSFVDFQKRHKLPKATLHNLLITLESLNFLRRDDETGRYFIGLAALEVAAAGAATPEDLSSLLSPILEKLVQEWNETCHLGILYGGEEVILKRLDPAEQVVRLATPLGRRHPAHATAGGLASMAIRFDGSLPTDLPDKLPQLTKNTIKSHDELLARLEEVKQQGYALDLEEAYIGVRCVGIAVSVPGWPVVHVSFSLPLQRASIDRLRALATPLMAAAADIEKILSVTPRA